MRERQVAALQLRMLRINSGFSQSELARRANVAHNTIGRLEAGELPSPDTAYKIATVFGKTPSEMWPELLEGRREVA